MRKFTNNKILTHCKAIANAYAKECQQQKVPFMELKPHEEDLLQFILKRYDSVDKKTKKHYTYEDLKELGCGKIVTGPNGRDANQFNCKPNPCFIVLLERYWDNEPFVPKSWGIATDIGLKHCTDNLTQEDLQYLMDNNDYFKIVDNEIEKDHKTK